MYLFSVLVLSHPIKKTVTTPETALVTTGKELPNPTPVALSCPELLQF
jgi:hypothetical protein